MSAIIRPRGVQIVPANEGPRARDGLLPFEYKKQCDDWSPLKFGKKTLLWLRDSRGVELKTIGEWKSLATLFAQATQALRPLNNNGGALFNGGTQFLTAGVNVIGAAGGCTVITQRALTAVPGAATYNYLCTLRQDATPKWIENFYTGDAAFHPWSFGIATMVPNTQMGVAGALGLGDDIELWTWNGGATNNAANFSARRNGVAKAVTARGSTTHTATTQTTIGAYVDVGTFPLNGTLYYLIVYDSVLSGANQAIAEALVASGTAKYPDFALLGNVVVCVLRGRNQSGDVLNWNDLSLFKRIFTQAVLANETYLDLDDSVGDGLTSMIANLGVGTMTTASIAEMGGATEMTWGIWLRQPAGGGTRFWQATTAGQYSWLLNNTGLGTLVFYISPDGVGLGDFLAVAKTADIWEHHGFVFRGAGATNADRLKHYLNGVKVAGVYTGNIPATIRASTDTVQFVGSGAGNTSRIDDPVIINKALSDTEMLKLATYYKRVG